MKKKRTVITEESHEVWIIRHDVRHHDDVHEADGTVDLGPFIPLTRDPAIPSLNDDNDPPLTTEVEEQ